MRTISYGWYIVAFAMIMQIFALGIFLFSFGIVLLPWTESFNVSRAQLTTVPIAMQIVSALISPVAGPMVDRFRARLLLLVGVLAVIVALYLLSLAGTFMEVMLISIIPGTIALKFAGPLLAQALTAKWFRTNLGLALAITAAGGSIGGLIMPPVMQWLIDLYGWRVAYEYLAIAAAVILLPMLLLVREAPVPEPAAGSDKTTSSAVNTDKASTSQGVQLGMLDILRDWVFLMITFGIAIIGAVYLALQYNLPAIGHDHGIAAARGALLLSMLAGTSAISKPVWGIAVDRIRPARIFASIALLNLVAIAVVVGIAGPIEYYHLLIAAACAGFSTGASQPLLGVVLTRRFGAVNIGKAYGVAMPILNASALGPMVAASAYTLTESYSIGFMVLALAVLLAAFAVVRILRNSSMPQTA